MTVYYSEKDPKKRLVVGHCKQCQKPRYDNERKGKTFCSIACKSEWHLTQQRAYHQRLELAELVLTKRIERLETQLRQLGATPCD